MTRSANMILLNNFRKAENATNDIHKLSFENSVKDGVITELLTMVEEKDARIEELEPFAEATYASAGASAVAEVTLWCNHQGRGSEAR